MKKKLTPKLIESLPPAKGKRYEVRDELLTGLHLRVSNTGAKVWYLATRIDGSAKRIKLGTFPILSLKDSREKAQMLLRDIQLGLHKPANDTPVVKTLTLGEIIPKFIEKHAKRHTKDWKGTKSVLMRMHKLHDYKIDAIKRKDVVKELERLVSDIEENGGKGTRANRGLAAIKKLYSWCIDQGIVEISPVVGLRPLIKEVARERWLTDEEIKKFWGACEKEGYPFGKFGQLLMLTGQRLREISAMRWSELDLEKGTLTLKAERTKNATLHVVPLPSQAIDLLKSLPRFLGSDFVFTTTGVTGISGYGRFKKRLDDAVGLHAEDWRFHDLRRTAATNMAMLGIQPHIIEAVLNHKTGVVSGVAAVYNRHAYFEEKRIALQQWNSYIAELAN